VTTSPPDQPTPEPSSAGPSHEPPVLPTRSADDTDAGWGERWDSERDPGSDDDRYLRERPPHWE